MKIKEPEALHYLTGVTMNEANLQNYKDIVVFRCVSVKSFGKFMHS